MIHIINKLNCHIYADDIESMFRIRHNIFVEQRGWRALKKPDGLERDELDNDDTIYFLKLCSSGRILGGMRLVPTTKPTQLSTIFRHTCTLAEPPNAPKQFEWSRYFIVDTQYRSATGKAVHMELYTGILEYAVKYDIEALSGFIDMQIYERSKRMPWNMKRLGVPVEYGGLNGEPLGCGLPIQLMVDRTMLRKTKIMWRMTKPVLATETNN
ncbi:MAG: acyl-homoserine-lactone synthase [Kordiimonas sp.]